MRCVLGITMGDPAGVGPEICVKALAEAKMYDTVIPMIIGEARTIENAIKLCGTGGRLNVINTPKDAVGKCGVVDVLDPCSGMSRDWQTGVESAAAGAAAYRCIERGIELAQVGDIDGVVTAPVNKHALALSGCKYAGHTEIFADKTGTENYAMLLVSDTLRVIHVSTHVALRRACELVTTERVLRVIRLAAAALKSLGVANGRIGVAGLNPHCSESGLFGTEEAEAIIPAVALARAEGIDADGPVPPDTVFVKAIGGAYDMVVAMYHDQGHIPLKQTGFRMVDGNMQAVSGVNITAGLPIIRTSVDHGTAFDIAGKGIANCDSLLDAIALAEKMAVNR